MPGTCNTCNPFSSAGIKHVKKRQKNTLKHMHAHIVLTAVFQDAWVSWLPLYFYHYSRQPVRTDTVHTHIR